MSGYSGSDTINKNCRDVTECRPPEQFSKTGSESKMKTRIHVNQHIIRQNSKCSDQSPPLTVKDYKQNRKAWTAEIMGPSRVVYSPDKPLACGAKVWIETDATVITNDGAE